MTERYAWRVVKAGQFFDVERYRPGIFFGWEWSRYPSVQAGEAFPQFTTLEDAEAYIRRASGHPNIVAEFTPEGCRA